MALIKTDLEPSKERKILPLLEPYIAWRDKNFPDGKFFEDIVGVDAYSFISNNLVGEKLFPGRKANDEFRASERGRANAAAIPSINKRPPPSQPSAFATYLNEQGTVPESDRMSPEKIAADSATRRAALASDEVQAPAQVQAQAPVQAPAPAPAVSTTRSNFLDDYNSDAPAPLSLPDEIEQLRIDAEKRPAAVEEAPSSARNIDLILNELAATLDTLGDKKNAGENIVAELRSLENMIKAPPPRRSPRLHVRTTAVQAVFDQKQADLERAAKAKATREARKAKAAKAGVSPERVDMWEAAASELDNVIEEAETVFPDPSAVTESERPEATRRLTLTQEAYEQLGLELELLYLSQTEADRASATPEGASPPSAPSLAGVMGNASTVRTAARNFKRGFLGGRRRKTPRRRHRKLRTSTFRRNRKH
jgi:hypothetical protein